MNILPELDVESFTDNVEQSYISDYRSNNTAKAVGATEGAVFAYKKEEPNDWYNCGEPGGIPKRHISHNCPEPRINNQG